MVAEFLAEARTILKFKAKPSGSISTHKRGLAKPAGKKARPSQAQEVFPNLRGHAPPAGERKLHAVCRSLRKAGQLANSNCGIRNRVKGNWPLAGSVSLVQALIESF